MPGGTFAARPPHANPRHVAIASPAVRRGEQRSAREARPMQSRWPACGRPGGPRPGARERVRRRPLANEVTAHGPPRAYGAVPGTAPDKNRADCRSGRAWEAARHPPCKGPNRGFQGWAREAAGTTVAAARLLLASRRASAAQLHYHRPSMDNRTLPSPIAIDGPCGIRQVERRAGTRCQPGLPLPRYRARCTGPSPSPHSAVASRPEDFDGCERLDAHARPACGCDKRHAHLSRRRRRDGAAPRPPRLKRPSRITAKSRRCALRSSPTSHASPRTPQLCLPGETLAPSSCLMHHSSST